MTALLPLLRGLRVLDAGCGSGWYSERFANAGAHVTACDVTPAFIEMAQARLGPRATILRHDLTQPLAFAADESFDLVFANLAFDYLPDLSPVLAEFARVLARGGWALFSMGHPLADWVFLARERIRLIDGEANYFMTQPIEVAWHGFGEPEPIVKSYRRPLGAIIRAIIDAGLTLDRLVEPQPIPSFREADPTPYDRLLREPLFIIFRAKKP
jgi:2-polyprenyl-6-hydroxyphenyl methylase/3-demethylubiquinone-9 3-methyltransferase